MKILSVDEFLNLLPDKGKQLLVKIGATTSYKLIENFLREGDEYTCERNLYLKFLYEKDGVKKLYYYCLRIQYSKNPHPKVLLPEQVELLLDMNPIEAILFDSKEDYQLHAKIHDSKSITFKPIHN